MSAPRQAAIRNQLLTILPTQDFDHLAMDLEEVELPRGRPLAAVGQPIDHVYFLTAGIASTVATTSAGKNAEAGIVGFDSYAPSSAVADIGFSPHNVGIQLAGEGYRISYKAFRAAMTSSPNLSKLMVCAMEAFAVQLAYTAASNAINDVSIRLARWLLMCHDRVMGDEIELTHEFLSIMLAVRRPSVTTSLHILEGRHLIKAERGAITILDRLEMEKLAGDAYGIPENEYQRIMKEVF